MQPLISPVDHESRNHDYEGETPDEPQEDTPLLRHYPLRRRSTITTIFVSIMLAILVFGIVVSLFLLMEQDRQWPVNLPFEMVSRVQWGAKPPQWPLKPTDHKPVSNVVLTHTGSLECNDDNTCFGIVKGLQNLYQGPQYNLSDLPFNFMVSGDGLTYEGRGWDVAGDVDANLNSNAISLAAIGNFSSMEPSSRQLQEIKSFLDECIWRRKLSPNYSILGRNFKGYPKQLFSAVRSWSHWNSTANYSM